MSDDDEEHDEGCLCDAPVASDEETEDEALPETNLVPGLDRPPKREPRK